jgi:hypothetical protein
MAKQRAFLTKKLLLVTAQSEKTQHNTERMLVVNIASMCGDASHSACQGTRTDHQVYKQGALNRAVLQFDQCATQRNLVYQSDKIKQA